MPARDRVPGGWEKTQFLEVRKTVIYAPEKAESCLLDSGIDILLSESEPPTSTWSVLIPGTRPFSVDFTQTIVARVGQPDLYAGGGAGVIIRWHRTGKTLTLAEEKLGLRLSLHSSATLKTAESAVFSAGVGTTQQQAPNHLSLPYLWRFERRPTGENALGTPRANDWQEVREALRSLFQIWAEQTPFLSVAGWCKNLGGLAFNLVNQAPKGCTLSVVHDPHDGLTVHLHDQPGITSDLSSDEMIARGWHMRLPLLNSWSAFYDFDSTSAETAADLIVKELSLQEGTTPLDIALTDPGESDELRLSLPGLPFHQR